MCGLYGYITHKNAKLNKKQREMRSNILKGLAIAMQERGTHSTGVAGVCKDHWCIVKKAASADKLIATDEFKAFLEHSPRVVIGHTRFATIGAVTDRNSHPFNNGNIIGAHNGHVSNWKDVVGNESEAEVDSEAIFHSLDQSNNDFKKALKEVRGKFAITWFDQRDTDKLYLVVDGNPLNIVRVPELQTYFWCSTYYALQSVVGSHVDLEGKTIWSPKPEYVYEFNGIHKIKKTKIEFGKYVYTAPTRSYSSGYQSSYTWNKDTEKAQAPLDDDHDEEFDMYEQDVIRHVGNNSIPFLLDKVSTVAQFNKLDELDDTEMEDILENSNECQFCQAKIDSLNDEMWWHQVEKMIMCYKCAEDLEDWQNYLYLEPQDLTDIDTYLWKKDNLSKSGGVGDSCDL